MLAADAPLGSSAAFYRWNPMNVGFFPFLIAALAVWRVSHLLTREDGPWDAIVRFRRLLSGRVGGQLLDCLYCLSLWVAVPAALWFRPSLTEFFVLWLALSGSACLLDRVKPEPVVIEHLPAPSKVGA